MNNSYKKLLIKYLVTAAIWLCYIKGVSYILSIEYFLVTNLVIYRLGFGQRLFGPGSGRLQVHAQDID